MTGVCSTRVIDEFREQLRLARQRADGGLNRAQLSARIVIDHRPAVAEEVSSLVASRQGALDDRRGAMSDAAGTAQNRERLVARVRAYFHLG